MADHSMLNRLLGIGLESTEGVLTHTFSRGARGRTIWDILRDMGVEVRASTIRLRPGEPPVYEAVFVAPTDKVDQVVALVSEWAEKLDEFRWRVEPSGGEKEAGRVD